MIEAKTVKEVSKACDCSLRLAHELLILSGNDPDLVIAASRRNYGLDQCKIDIIDKRFKKLEKMFDEEEEE